VVHEIYRFPEFEAAGVFKLYLVAYAWLVCWQPASFVHLMAVLPRPRWQGKRLATNSFVWLVALTYAVPIYFVARIVQTGTLPDRSFMTYYLVCAVLGVAMLAERYGRRAR